MLRTIFESKGDDESTFHISRKASEHDLRRFEENKAVAAKARDAFARNVSNERHHIKVLDARFSLDRSRLRIFYGVEEATDLRRYINQIQRDYNTKVDLCQVGVRDEAMLTGGLAVCGRPLCCTSLGVDGSDVNVRMAKAQDISMSSGAVNGMCGRLKCCLKYECEQYAEASQSMPAPGEWVTLPGGGRAMVISRDILNGKLTLRHSDGVHQCYTLRELRGGFNPSNT